MWNAFGNKLKATFPRFISAGWKGVPMGGRRTWKVTVEWLSCGQGKGHHSTRNFKRTVRGPNGWSGRTSPKSAAVTGCPFTPLTHVCRLNRLYASAPKRKRRFSLIVKDLNIVKS